MSEKLTHETQEMLKDILAEIHATMASMNARCDRIEGHISGILQTLGDLHQTLGETHLRVERSDRRLDHLDSRRAEPTVFVMRERYRSFLGADRIRDVFLTEAQPRRYSQPPSQYVSSRAVSGSAYGKPKRLGYAG